MVILNLLWALGHKCQNVCGYFVTYLLALLGVSGMVFRDQFVSLSASPPLVAHA